MTDEETRGSRDAHDQDPPVQDPSGEGFAEAWERGDDLDVGADTSRFEAFRGDDTAELLRRQVRDDDAPGDSPAVHAQPDPPSGPNAGVVVGVLVVVFVIVTVLYLLN